MEACEAQAAAVGAERVASLDDMEVACKKHANLLSLSVPDPEMTALAGRLSGHALTFHSLSRFALSGLLFASRFCLRRKGGRGRRTR